MRFKYGSNAAASPDIYERPRVVENTGPRKDREPKHPGECRAWNPWSWLKNYTKRLRRWERYWARLGATPPPRKGPAK